RTLTHIKDQKGGLHSLQEIKVCEIHEDRSTRGSWHFYYDGELFLSQNLETQEWTVPQSSRAQTLAINIMNFWKEDAMKTKTHYRAVQADCLQKLQRYLESGIVLRRIVPPMVNVTCSEASEGNITMTCRASSFYPWNITLTWRQDGISLSHDAQQWGDVLPDRNGTYQTWVATRIRQGEEQRFTCYMEHSGNRHSPSGMAVSMDRLSICFCCYAMFCYYYYSLRPLLQEENISGRGSR
uniref:MHC class I polypeptide-related sequence B n=1 Tax=Pongo abelii TaxID=9601 RepID=A0A8I5UNC9_PONAB